MRNVMTNYFTLLRKASPCKLKEEGFVQRIGLISIGVSLVIIFLVVSLFVFYTKQNRHKEIIDDGLALTEMVANYSAKGLGYIDADNIIEIVDIMGRKSGLVYAMIIDADGRVLTHTDTRLLNHKLTDPIALRAVSSNNPLQQVYQDHHTDNTIREFSRPLYSGGIKEGAVRIGFSEDTPPLFSGRDIRGLFLIATLIFSLVPVFYYLVRKSPQMVLSLHEELNKLIAKNDFETIAVDSGQTMDTVSDKFREIIARYRDKHQKLSVSCEELEIANSILSYEKERMGSVIDSIDEGIMVRDMVGTIIHVNRTMVHLMNLSGRDVVGKTIQDCIHHEEIISFIERNQLSGSSFTQKNLELTLNQTGGEKAVLISYLALLSPEESVQGTDIIAKDITAVKMARQNQSDFISHLSHELRTPLTTIKS